MRRRPPTIAPSLLAAILAMGLAGCAALERSTSTPSASAGSRGTLSREELRKELVAISSVALARSRDVAEDVSLSDLPARRRAELFSICIDLAWTPLTYATSVDIGIAAIDNAVAMSRWARSLPEVGADELETRLLLAIREVDDLSLDLVRRITSPKDFAVIAAAIAAAEPNASVRTVRDEISAEGASLPTTTIEVLRAAEPGLFGSLDQAAREIERGRAAVERGIIFGERLPFLLQLQGSLFRAETLGSSELTAMAGTAATLAGNIDRLAGAIDGVSAFRNEVLKAVEDVSAAAPATREAIGDARALIEEIRAAMPEANSTTGELRAVLASAERVTASLGELLAPGADGQRVDIAALEQASDRFARAAADLRATMEQANALLADEATLGAPLRRIQDLADTGRASVDHVAWRIALLMVIAASLGMVLMVVRSLTRPRPEPAQRTPRG